MSSYSATGCMEQDVPISLLDPHQRLSLPRRFGRDWVRWHSAMTWSLGSLSRQSRPDHVSCFGTSAFHLALWPHIRHSARKRPWLRYWHSIEPGKSAVIVCSHTINPLIYPRVLSLYSETGFNPEHPQLQSCRLHAPRQAFIQCSGHVFDIRYSSGHDLVIRAQ